MCDCDKPRHNPVFKNEFPWVAAMPFIFGPPLAIILMILHSLGIINIDRIP